MFYLDGLRPLPSESLDAAVAAVGHEVETVFHEDLRLEEKRLQLIADLAHALKK